VNYDVYKLSYKDFLLLLGKTIVITCIFSYLFYQSVWGCVVSPILFLLLRTYEKKKQMKIRKQKIHEEFMESLKIIGTSLMAGFSMENAWREAEIEMKESHGSNSYMCRELTEMNRLIHLNVPVENVLSDFAYRTGIDDIISFAEVFEYGKRSGGNWRKIIEDTIYRMEEKFETSKEIEVLLAGKKLEQNIMNVLPLFIIAFLQISSGGYMDVLYGNPLGVLCMSVCMLGYVIAICIANRILNIQV